MQFTLTQPDGSVGTFDLDHMLKANEDKPGFSMLLQAMQIGESIEHRFGDSEVVTTITRIL